MLLRMLLAFGALVAVQLLFFSSILFWVGVTALALILFSIIYSRVN